VTVPDPDRRIARWRWGLAALGVTALGAVVLNAVGVWRWAGSDPSALVRSQSVLDDRDRYDTALEAGDAFAAISGLLLTEARACAPKTTERDRCDAVAEAAAFSQALAVRVLDCTAPGRFEARRVLRAHLSAIDAMAPGDSSPSLPLLPVC